MTTDSGGNVAFNALLPVLPPAGQTVITATATDPDNNTSEFSLAIEAPLGAGQLLNISTRLAVLTGDNVLIGGFIILGDDPKEVVVRAIGPSLGNFGLSGALEGHRAGAARSRWNSGNQRQLERYPAS